MAAVNPTDYSVAANGDIRYEGTTTNNTVIEFHRWLQDLADDEESSGDDLLAIVDDTPSDRSTDNIITLLSPYNIDDDLAKHLFDGSITQEDGDTVYSGLVVVGTVEAGTELMIIQNKALLTSFWSTGINADAGAQIISRMLIKTRASGADIDGNRILVMAREFGDTYAEFAVTMGLGNNVAAIFTYADLNNETAEAVVGAWGITNTEGYQLLEISGSAPAEPYYSQWDLGIQSINDLYEFTKRIQRRGTAETIHGMSGDLFRGITHQVLYTDEATGPFVEDEELSWGTGATAGTGVLLALLDEGTTGTLWIQLTSGVAPNANTISGATATATASTVTSRTISPAFVGQSTGSAIIGAYGIGVDPTDLTANDKVFDLGNNLVTPPNNVTFTVYGLASGEDRVLVGPEAAGVLEVDQLTLDGAHSSGTTVTVIEDIPSDTPAIGTIRVLDTSGVYQRMAYSSWTGKVFTVPTITTTHDSAANVWISYIDVLADATSEAFTGVYSTDRSLFIRVRDGGATPIKTFETTGTLGTAGGSTTAIRTSDA